MAGTDPLEDDEFPPRRPFGVPARRTSPDPDEDDAGAAPAVTDPGRSQPPASPS